MKIILNTFLITLFSFASYAQEYVWSVYNIKVDKLHRYEFAGLNLGNLKSGEYKRISLKKFKKLVDIK